MTDSSSMMDISVKNEDESDSNWSDVKSDDGEDDDLAEKSLRIDLHDEEESEIALTKSVSKRTASVSFTATSGSSKKSKL